jgi:steroid delta-isomerase-like uncharacterized protein
MTQEIKAKIERFVEEGFNKMDLAAFDEFYAPGCVRHVPPLPDMHGVEALKQYGVELRRDVFSDVHMTIQEIIVEDEKAASRWTWEATHTGQSATFPFPATGKRLTITGCTIYRFLDGKCAEEWEHQDMVGALQQMGVFPQIGEGAV